MAIELIGKLKPKNGASFKILDAVDINWEGASVPLEGLPNASADTKGIVQIGANLSVDEGVVGLSKENVEAAIGYEAAKASDVAEIKAQFADGKVNAAEAADKLTTARNIALTGDVTGTASFDGSADVEITATLGGIDASKITSGTIDIARLPQGALGNLVIVANDEERLALTAEQVRKGDTVKVTETGIMYLVVDESKLGTEEAFSEYTAGKATSVDWSGVENKPEAFKPEAHTHVASDITAMTGYTGDLFTESDSLNAALKKIEDKLDNAGGTYELPTATDEVLGGVKIGDNITANAGKISVTKDNVVTALGYEPPKQDTTYKQVTRATDGLMIAADKAKLDNLENFVLKAANADNLGGVKIGKNITVTEDGTISVADPIDTTPFAKKTDDLAGDLTGTIAKPKITDGAVVTDKIADGAVSTAKVANAAITDNKIADNSLSTSKLFVPIGDVLIFDGGTAAS